MSANNAEARIVSALEATPERAAVIAAFAELPPWAFNYAVACTMYEAWQSHYASPEARAALESFRKRCREYFDH